MEKFSNIKKINETTEPLDGNNPSLGFDIVKRFTTPDGGQPVAGGPGVDSVINPDSVPSAVNPDGTPGISEIPVVTKSEPCKFVSKIFESRQMAHVYHLEAQGAGAYGMHMALDNYYKSIVELNDELIEVYQGQYDIIGDYETIDCANKGQEPVQYFIELAEFIKSTRKIAFVPEDTHLQNIIDEMVSLVYKTIYKLKFLK